MSSSSIYPECLLGGWNFFKGGMNISQAQAESTSTPYNSGVSGYWYYSSLLTAEMCINSCLKYDFTMAAIEPK